MDLNTIKEEIRAEAERIRAQLQYLDQAGGAAAGAEEIGRNSFREEPPTWPLPPLRLFPVEFAPEPDAIKAGVYRYADLSQFEDREFIRVAYRVLLRHSPDPQGERSYLTRLRAGAHKAEILLRLRLSAEGRARRVWIRGLLWRLPFAALVRLPLIGWLIRRGALFILLPARFARLVQRQELGREAVNRNLVQIERRLNDLSDTVTRLAEERARRPESP
jgi:Domain of unknown function (DUF4214)